MDFETSSLEAIKSPGGLLGFSIIKDFCVIKHWSKCYIYVSLNSLTVSKIESRRDPLSELIAEASLRYPSLSTQAILAKPPIVLMLQNLENGDFKPE